MHAQHTHTHMKTHTDTYICSEVRAPAADCRTEAQPVALNLSQPTAHSCNTQTKDFCYLYESKYNETFWGILGEDQKKQKKLFFKFVIPIEDVTKRRFKM